MARTLMLQPSTAGAGALAPQERLVVRQSARVLGRWLVQHRQALWLVTLVLLAAFAHGLNMFHFPYYEDDEGTYVAQAWAVAHQGQLAPYTYWYDHAPLGWIQIAAWTILTGGLHAFGGAIQSGRTLMLLMQMASTAMLYRIARSVSGSATAATVACLLFALSPYGIYFHRRVLLDNITTVWMLLSIVLLVSGHLSLKRVWLSALALGISILSKELTFFLIPVMAYLVFFRADRSHRWLATIGWIAIVGSIVSLYVLMATLKGELLPTGTLLGGTHPHVSLLGTLRWQASRGKDGGVFDVSSQFWHMAPAWLRDDPILVAGGSICAILSMLAIKRQRLVGVMGALTLFLWAFLGRGGEVIGFYLVPLLPLLALNVGLVLGLAAGTVKRYLAASLRWGAAIGRGGELLAAGLCVLGILAAYSSPVLGFQSNPLLLWNGGQAGAQNEAVAWIKAHVAPRSSMIIDMSMWPDLHDTSPVYGHAHYYWKVEDDPAIRNGVFHDDWHKVDYVVTTPQLLSDVQAAHMTLVGAALQHSTPVAHFDTGGWTVEVRRVQTSNRIVAR